VLLLFASLEAVVFEQQQQLSMIKLVNK
jgi:hypothetical protein